MHVAVPVGPVEADAGTALRRHEAFRAAITPLMSVAFRVLRRLGVQEMELDDALQTVLVVVHRRFDGLTSPQDLKAYLCAVCVNVARDFGRVRKKRMARDVEEETLDRTATADPGPDVVLDRKQALELLERILESLDEKRREVFVLYEFEELTGEEIAEHLGIPLGTVSSRLRRARDDFRAAVARVQAAQGSHGRGQR